VSLTDDITDPRLAKALAHPLRLEILRHLGDRTASPSEIAAEIGAPLTNVSYHVRKLRALGLIKLVRKTPKRGVIEHYYSAQPRRAVTDEAWAQTPPIVKQALIDPLVGSLSAEMAKAASSGGFERSDMHVSAQHLTLDDKGWKAISAVLKKALGEMDKIEDEARERLKADPHGDSLAATAAIALFETPKREAPQPDSKPTSRRRARATASRT
jgi:DNA-binding transcriptional ArsR family regulator